MNTRLAVGDVFANVSDPDIFFRVVDMTDLSVAFQGSEPLVPLNWYLKSFVVERLETGKLLRRDGNRDD